MKSIIFDTGPIISLATNNLLWVLGKLHERYNGEFYISRHVENELITKSLRTKRFKFEALQVLRHVRKGTIRIIHQKNIETLTNELLGLANNIFKAKGQWVRIVQAGEMEALAASIILDADAVVVDERTTRHLVEEPFSVKKIMEKKMHTKVYVHKANLKKFSSITKKVKIIRSIELVMAAYELGWLKAYLPDMRNAKTELLDSVLWGLKLRGCSISRREIDKLIKIERQH
ncbi:hypothetical protein ACFLZ7_02780 [Nanoarchaeota archaeon]